MEYYDKHDKSIASLVELGTNGHFPLFDSHSLNEYYKSSKKKLTGNEKIKVKKLLQKISKYKSIERKKTLLISMKNEERVLILKAFFLMVETKILNNSPVIQ